MPLLELSNDDVIAVLVHAAMMPFDESKTPASYRRCFLQLASCACTSRQLLGCANDAATLCARLLGLDLSLANIDDMHIPAAANIDGIRSSLRVESFTTKLFHLEDKAIQSRGYSEIELTSILAARSTSTPSSPLIALLRRCIMHAPKIIPLEPSQRSLRETLEQELGPHGNAVLCRHEPIVLPEKRHGSCACEYANWAALMRCMGESAADTTDEALQTTIQRGWAEGFDQESRSHFGGRLVGKPYVPKNAIGVTEIQIGMHHRRMLADQLQVVTTTPEADPRIALHTVNAVIECLSSPRGTRLPLIMQKEGYSFLVVGALPEPHPALLVANPRYGGEIIEVFDVTDLNAVLHDERADDKPPSGLSFLFLCPNAIGDGIGQVDDMRLSQLRGGNFAVGGCVPVAARREFGRWMVPLPGPPWRRTVHDSGRLFG